ncbi:outer membrane protein assembly factor BamE domain-containing protein, partial [Alteromonas mediterranea]
MKVKLALIALGALALTGCSKLTKENYDKLEMGMTQDEVESILGSA